MEVLTGKFVESPETEVYHICMLRSGPGADWFTANTCHERLKTPEDALKSIHLSSWGESYEIKIVAVMLPVGEQKCSPT